MNIINSPGWWGEDRKASFINSAVAVFLFPPFDVVLPLYNDRDSYPNLNFFLEESIRLWHFYFYFYSFIFGLAISVSQASHFNNYLLLSF